MGALETLQAKFECQLLLVESGGDNLAANYSRELADYIIYVIDVSVRFPLPLSGVSVFTKHRQREETRFQEKVDLGFPNPIYWSSTRYCWARIIHALMQD